MAFQQDIRVNIAIGAVKLSEAAKTILILGSGSAQIGRQYITKASELLSFGYVSTDIEWKMAASIFEQIPTVQKILVARKAAATAYSAELDALLLAKDDFKVVLIDSDVLADANSVGSWANTNTKFFLGRNSSITAGNGRNVLREAYYIHDKLKTAGYQDISSESIPFIGATVPAIVAADYDIDVLVDSENSGSPWQVTVSLLLTDTWTAIVGKIETALQTLSTTAPTVSLVNGKIRVKSATSNAESKIAISSGTAGSAGGDLLTYIDDNIASMITKIEQAINGTEIFPEAAIAGRKIGKSPQLTWKWKRPQNIPASDFNTTQLITIRNNNSQTVVEQAGSIHYDEGITTSGEYIDTVFGIDFIEEQITLNILRTLVTQESVPLDDGGISVLEGDIRSALSLAGQEGIIAKLDEESSDVDKSKSDDGVFMFKVNMPKRSEINATDRSNRVLSGVTFSYTLAGAIHEADVNGTLEV